MRDAMVAIAVLLALAARAHAQEPPPPVPPPALVTPEDPSFMTYHEAFVHLSAGRVAEARLLLDEIVRTRPGEPVAASASVVLAALAAPTPAPIGDQPDEDMRAPEPHTRGARAELAGLQTLHGIAAGLEVCAIVECGAGGFLLLAAGVGGAGLGGSLLATEDGLTSGHAALINSGTLWGAFNGIGILVLTGADRKPAAGLLIGAQATGTAGSALLWGPLRPKVGQVSMANTVGTWTGTLTLFAHGALDFPTGDKALMAALLVTADGGLIAGAILSSYYPMGRGRALLIDAGGMVGALAGLGVGVLISGEQIESKVSFQAMIPGSIVGLGLATWFTRNWDARKQGPAASVTIAPLPRGGLSAGIAGSF